MDAVAASTSMRSPHCSNCGHPGSKRAHSKVACAYCVTNGSEFSCVEKSNGFKCICPSCDQVCHYSVYSFWKECLLELKI